MSAKQPGHHAYRKSRPEKIINSILESEEIGMCVRNAQGEVVSQNHLSKTICGDQLHHQCLLCGEEPGRMAAQNGMSHQQTETIAGVPTHTVTLKTDHGQMKYLSPLELQRLPLRAQLKTAHLTPKETRIAELLIQNKSNASIMTELNITKATLKTHINHLYQKAEFLKKIRQVP